MLHSPSYLRESRAQIVSRSCSHMLTDTYLLTLSFRNGRFFPVDITSAKKQSSENKIGNAGSSYSTPATSQRQKPKKDLRFRTATVDESLLKKCFSELSVCITTTCRLEPLTLPLSSIAVADYFRAKDPAAFYG